MSDVHADLEALSAYVDGEGPEWADHVAGCAACRASAEQLRSVAAAVGAPVGPPPAGQRERAVAAALGDVGTVGVRQATERSRFERRRSEWRWALPAVAAVVVGVMGFSTLVARNTGSSDRTTLAGPTAESAPALGDASGGAKADSSAAASPAPSDLGDVPDAASLLARARPGLAVTTGRSGVAAPSTAPTTVTTASPTGRLPAPAVVGTRPCEEQARAREPGLREVVYFATARRGQVPAVVLGFTTGPGTGTAPAPVILLLLAQNGCGELLRASGP